MSDLAPYSISLSRPIYGIILSLIATPHSHHDLDPDSPLCMVAVEGGPADQQHPKDMLPGSAGHLGGAVQRRVQAQPQPPQEDLYCTANLCTAFNNYRL